LNVHYRLDHLRSDRWLYREQDRKWLGQGLLLDIVLGIVGAVVGGYLFAAFGATGVTGFNLWSMLVAIVGAALVLWIYHAVVGRQT
jgi:uncharacterized membrane protein YeaQ/YmgE (transglycosylase-associated protein family)